MHSQSHNMSQARSDWGSELMPLLVQDGRGSSDEHTVAIGMGSGQGVTVSLGPNATSREAHLHGIERQLTTLVTQHKKTQNVAMRENAQTRGFIAERDDGTRALVEKKGSQLQALVAGQGDAVQVRLRQISRHSRE